MSARCCWRRDAARRRSGRLAVLLAVLAAAVLPPRAVAECAPAWAERARARLVDPPLGLPPLYADPSEAPSAELIALGRRLFFDRRLSRAGTMSCGMCHIPEQGFTSNELRTPVGTGGASLRRNAPSLFNVAYRKSLFHDGREPFLETQPVNVFLEPREFALPSAGAVVERVRSLPEYAGAFERIFGGPATLDRIGAALAAYERTLLSAGSPFDRWYYGGEEDALDEAAKRGFALFTGRAGCARCHLVGPKWALFSDGGFHNTGAGYREAPPEKVRVQLAPGVFTEMERKVVESVGEPAEPDLGRHEVTRDPADLRRFATPSLRNVALTAPYMHDGSLSTLEEVVRFYDRGGGDDPAKDPLLRPLGLSEREIADLVAFLRSLTGDDVDALIGEARSSPPDG